MSKDLDDSPWPCPASSCPERPQTARPLPGREAGLWAICRRLLALAPRQSRAPPLRLTELKSRGGDAEMVLAGAVMAALDSWRWRWQNRLCPRAGAGAWGLAVGAQAAALCGGVCCSLAGWVLALSPGALCSHCWLGGGVRAACTGQRLDTSCLQSNCSFAPCRSQMKDTPVAKKVTKEEATSKSTPFGGRMHVWEVHTRKRRNHSVR
ncbi:hypothetical protein NDU88_008847 [Pleurodeles waltl]|uniref:Uncharacterized protein n=1 Tax=Pleurodeles waltl TaxID=8319 RepID=A0AAV7P0F3_PLEWA|nr:hypothetical protein NDU88_008847 [Pleurodeles waltl]